MSRQEFGEAFVMWAKKERSILALILIGSRSRVADSKGAADCNSDWDFQVVTTKPGIFLTPAWTSEAGLGRPLAYTSRVGRLGNSNKVSIAFGETEMDVVILPAGQIRMLRFLYVFRIAQRIYFTKTALGDLAMIYRAGYRVLKGGYSWTRFVSSVASDFPEVRISQDTIISIANGFVCDYISTIKKIDRGEFLAAQRWLHLHLADANYRLLHELRLRLGETSFPDARRIETTLSPDWLEVVQLESPLKPQPLFEAVEKSASACRKIVQALVGDQWNWPELPVRLQGGQAN